MSPTMYKKKEKANREFENRSVWENQGKRQTQQQLKTNLKKARPFFSRPDFAY